MDSNFQFPARRAGVLTGLLRSAAMTGLSPKASAFCVPETAKRASPAPSNTSTGLRSRSIPENQQKVMMPANSETAR